MVRRALDIYRNCTPSASCWESCGLGVVCFIKLNKCSLKGESGRPVIAAIELGKGNPVAFPVKRTRVKVLLTFWSIVVYLAAHVDEFLCGLLGPMACSRGRVSPQVCCHLPGQ